MPRLLVISSAPYAEPDNMPYLDKKFVEGMTTYAAMWDGPVSCLLRKRGAAFAFGQHYNIDKLPFGVRHVNAGDPITAAHLSGYDIVMCSADNPAFLRIHELCKAGGQKIVYTIEYTLQTRQQIARLDHTKSGLKRTYAMALHMWNETLRKIAFRRADGLQGGGYPGYNAYSGLNPNPLLYLDNRMEDSMLATEAEMGARRDSLLGGEPLRLIHSGRLERMKGSHDLIPVARRLVEKGVDFTLDIFGAGSLEAEIERDIQTYNLQNRVKLHGVLDFKTELVPYTRRHSDIFLSCHRQSDPSCTYLESMGCGVPVAGYANQMWAELCEKSNGGWTAPFGDVNALADLIAQASEDRPAVIDHCENARSFAQDHSFEKEFRKRIDHLKGTLDRPQLEYS